MSQIGRGPPSSGRRFKPLWPRGACEAHPAEGLRVRGCPRLVQPVGSEGLDGHPGCRMPQREAESGVCVRDGAGVGPLQSRLDC